MGRNTVQHTLQSGIGMRVEHWESCYRNAESPCKVLGLNFVEIQMAVLKLIIKEDDEMSLNYQNIIEVSSDFSFPR